MCGCNGGRKKLAKTSVEVAEQAQSSQNAAIENSGESSKKKIR